MANCLIAYDNLIDDAVLSGGVYETTMPLTNLQNRTLGVLARSVGLGLGATQFSMSIPADRPVRIIAVANHNLSLNSRYRITASGIDTGWLDVWPVVYDSDQLPWQATNWWSGRYTSREIEGVTWTLIHDLGQAYTLTDWTIEFDDSSNEVGYVEFGRAFIADAWVPEVNMMYGAGIGWETGTMVQKAISEAEFFDPRTPFRVARFATEWMNENEAMGAAFDIQARVGIDGEVVFMWNPDDTYHAVRRQFIGRLRSLSPLDNPNVAIWKTAWEVKELL